MFRALAAVTIGAGILCLIAAIWFPGIWWQLGATGVMLLIAGAALAGTVKDGRP